MPLSTGEFSRQFAQMRENQLNNPSPRALGGTYATGGATSGAANTAVGAKEFTVARQPDRRGSGGTGMPTDPSEHSVTYTAAGTVSPVAPVGSTAFGSQIGAIGHKWDRALGQAIRLRQYGALAAGSQPNQSPAQTASDMYQAGRPQFTTGSQQ